ncbi:MAG: hypothetical protein QGH66_03375 [Dehalococcoidia bacterium]|jgi:hypothetical protein|nr:hypothetical protein [Dehalococcoidia bacterium]MDP7240298.1 hypothetical protein [Dehalococcoidia bacterium]MDP7469756.1 hypothetical protein [Dehalococcoidia bacterium]
MPQRLKERFSADKSWITTETDVASPEALAEFPKAKRGAASG